MAVAINMLIVEDEAVQATGHLLTRLNYGRLVCVRRSYAVNLGRVNTSSDREVYLLGRNLPLGRPYKLGLPHHFTAC